MAQAQLVSGQEVPEVSTKELAADVRAALPGLKAQAAGVEGAIAAVEGWKLEAKIVSVCVVTTHSELKLKVEVLRDQMVFNADAKTRLEAGEVVTLGKLYSPDWERLYNCTTRFLFIPTPLMHRKDYVTVLFFDSISCCLGAMVTCPIPTVPTPVCGEGRWHPRLIQ